jgi:gamma-glutamyltranspeptidase/glutathione hydrolase
MENFETHGMVVANNRISAEAGLAILKNGGNAVDAAVAAALMEAVVAPSSCGIGGYGGCMVIYWAREQKAVSLNFNSVAPMTATPEMFVGKGNANKLGALAVGVPATLRGLETAVKKFGKKSWAEVIAPAQEVAERGVVVSKAMANNVNSFAARMEKFPVTAAMLMPNQRPPLEGETVRLPELAQSLRLIARDGADVFYEGELAQRIVDYLQSQSGLLTMKDLQPYQPTLSQPLQTAFHDATLFTPPLPAGGASALQTLRVLERMPLPFQPTGGYFHYLIQTFKFIWRERLTLMGDPAFVDVPMQQMLSDERADEIAERVMSGIEPPSLQPDEDASCTTHVCAADAEGNWVSLTHTHGESFGSMVTVPGTGILLGHGMSRFEVTPGRANSVAPGKQPLHNMCPTFICKSSDSSHHRHSERSEESCREILRSAQNDSGKAVLGLPGGRRIVNVIAQMVVNLIQFDMNVADAIAAPRLHCEGSEPIQVEDKMPQATIEALRQRMHDIQLVSGVGGSASGIVWDAATQRVEGAADPRGQGAAVSSDQ